jgi:hypothetical protein
MDKKLKDELAARLVKRGYAASQVGKYLNMDDFEAADVATHPIRKARSSRKRSDMLKGAQQRAQISALEENQRKQLWQERILPAIRAAARQEYQNVSESIGATKATFETMEEKPDWYELYVELATEMGFREAMYIAWRMQPKLYRVPRTLKELAPWMGLGAKSIYPWKYNHPWLEREVEARKEALGEKYLGKRYDLDALFAYLVEYKRHHDGNGPTLRTICDEFSVSGTSMASLLLRKLQDQGKIEIIGGVIYIVGGKWDYDGID